MFNVKMPNNLIRAFASFEERGTFAYPKIASAQDCDIAMSINVDRVDIDWDGPLSIDEAIRLGDPAVDIGLYQIYGSSYVYGLDFLLYIGKAETHFAQSLSEHWLDSGQNCENLWKVYVGRIRLSELDRAELLAIISRIKTLLTAVHLPAYNSDFLSENVSLKDTATMDICNWGQYGNLFPEFSRKGWPI